MPDTYFDLVHQFPLRPIRSDDQLHRANGMIDKLLRMEIDSGADDYLDVLSTLVEAYETATIPVRDMPGADVLRELMRGHGLTQAELSRKTGIAQSTLSAILSGDRSITVKHAEILGKYFATGAGAFLPL
jgi:HTH-type transcriptional regulator/antitoxin HigA